MLAFAYVKISALKNCGSQTGLQFWMEEVLICLNLIDQVIGISTISSDGLCYR